MNGFAAGAGAGAGAGLAAGGGGGATGTGAGSAFRTSATTAGAGAGVAFITAVPFALTPFAPTTGVERWIRVVWVAISAPSTLAPQMGQSVIPWEVQDVLQIAHFDIGLSPTGSLKPPD